MRSFTDLTDCSLLGHNQTKGIIAVKLFPHVISKNEPGTNIRTSVEIVDCNFLIKNIPLDTFRLKKLHTYNEEVQQIGFMACDIPFLPPPPPQLLIG